MLKKSAAFAMSASLAHRSGLPSRSRSLASNGASPATPSPAASSTKSWARRKNPRRRIPGARIYRPPKQPRLACTELLGELKLAKIPRTINDPHNLNRIAAAKKDDIALDRKTSHARQQMIKPCPAAGHTTDRLLACHSELADPLFRRRLIVLLNK